MRLSVPDGQAPDDEMLPVTVRDVHETVLHCTLLYHATLYDTIPANYYLLCTIYEFLLLVGSTDFVSKSFIEIQDLS